MSEAKVTCIDVHELKLKRQENPKLYLIDVREKEEWDQIHIPGAIHIPKDFIATCIQEVTEDKLQPIYLQCRSGGRSMYAAQILISLGYKHVFSINGGIQDWSMFGYDVIESKNVVAR